MVGKLIKHELKSSSRSLIPAIIASAVIALLFFFANISFDSEIDFYEAAAAFVMTMTSVLFFAGIITIIQYIISSFTKRVYGREGYLTLTLPVNPIELLASRVVVIFIWIAVMAVIFLVGIFLFALLIYLSYNNGEFLGEFLNIIFKEFAGIWSNFNIPIVLFSGILGILSFISAVWFSVSLANTKYIRNYRGVFAVGIFVVIQIITGVITDFLYGVFGNGRIEVLRMNYSVYGAYSSATISYVSIFLQILLTAAFFAGVIYILNKKLELE